eukprot:1156662-Pelagomonas_calceolata.AAC.11
MAHFLSQCFRPLRTLPGSSSTFSQPKSRRLLDICRIANKPRTVRVTPWNPPSVPALQTLVRNTRAQQHHFTPKVADTIKHSHGRSVPRTVRVAPWNPLFVSALEALAHATRVQQHRFTAREQPEEGGRRHRHGSKRATRRCRVKWPAAQARYCDTGQTALHIYAGPADSRAMLDTADFLFCGWQIAWTHAHTCTHQFPGYSMKPRCCIEC